MGQLTLEQRAGIAYLREQGLTVRSIAMKVGCSPSTVQKWATSSKQGRGVARKRRDVKKRLLDSSAAQRAEQLLKSKHGGGARFASAQLFKEGLSVRLPSRYTVVRAAKEAAKESGDPLKYVRGPPKKGLLARNKKARLAFCRANSDRDWDKVMFTDRCKFHFRYPGNEVGAGAWTSASERGSGRVFTPNHPQCYNVYGGLTVHGTTKLMPVTGTSGVKGSYCNAKGVAARNITAAEYREVVGRHFLPSGEAIFGSHSVRSWVLQQDGDPTHRASKPVVAEFNRRRFSSVEILPDWPGNSPDLSPIENVWGIVRTNVDKKGCKTFDEYKRAVDREFEQLDKGVVKRMFQSMPKRMRDCVLNDGDRIDY